MIKNNPRSNSPYSYFEEHNKRTTTEISYPRSQNPSMYMWNLSFQQLNKFDVPKPFFEQHDLKMQERMMMMRNSTTAYPDDSESTPASQQMRHAKYTTTKATNKTNDNFLVHNRDQQKVYIAQLMGESQHSRTLKPPQSSTTRNGKLTTLRRVMSQMSLEKLESLHDQRIQTEQVEVKKSSQYLAPKFNRGLNAPLGQFLSLVESTKQNFRHPKRRHQKAEQPQLRHQQSQQPQHMDSPHRSHQSMVQQREVQSKHEIYPKIASQLKIAHQAFRMRQPEELQFNPHKNKTRLNSASQQRLTDKITNVFNESDIYIATAATNDKKYFYNFNRYFLNNYQQSGNVQGKLSLQTETKLRSFQSTILNFVHQDKRKS